MNLDKGPEYSLTGKGLSEKPSDIPGTQKEKIIKFSSFLALSEFFLLIHIFSSTIKVTFIPPCNNLTINFSL